MGSSDMNLSCHANARVKVHTPYGVGSQPSENNTKMGGQ